MLEQLTLDDDIVTLRLSESEQEIMRQSHQTLKANLQALENEVHFLKSLLRTRTSCSPIETPHPPFEPMKRTHHLKRH
jgi:hypothetical protein